MRLRAADIGDTDLLFEWVNDPTKLEVSLSQEPVEFADHVRWLEAAIKGDTHRIYIFEDGMEPIGQIRFSKDGSALALSYYIRPDRRGKGYGRVMLEKGLDLIRRSEPGLLIYGLIQLENEASCRTFLKAGFKKVGCLDLGGRRFYRFEL